MSSRSLLETINFAKHQFSLLLVDPKPAMVAWVQDFQRKHGLERYRLCYPESNLVVIIPKDDWFSRVPGSFERFLDKIKPRLLRADLRRFMDEPEDFPHPMTKETFDTFYTLSLRESAMLITDFKDAEDLCTISE